MSILIDQKTVALIQGITGKQGTLAVRVMSAYPTKVAAGVTPGKGGQYVEGVPIYNTVAEALAAHSNINASLISVPPPAVKLAALEAIDNRVPLIVILTEHVPMFDSAIIVAAARKKNVRVIGPSSVGIISPGKAKIGCMSTDVSNRVYAPGTIGVISKSGGMCAEISHILKNHGLGQSTVVGIGGDRIIGITYADLIDLFEHDPDTRGIVIYGELGGIYEEELADAILACHIRKPIAAFISGKFAQALPHGLPFGHSGAIIEGNKGRPDQKITALRKAGVLIADVPEELAMLIKTAIDQKNK